MKGCLSIRVHWLHRKVGEAVFIVSRVVLQFINKRHCIWGRLRARVAAVFHSNTQWITSCIWKQMFCYWPTLSKIFATVAPRIMRSCILLHLIGLHAGNVETYWYKIWTTHRYRHSNVYRAQYTRWSDLVFKQVCARQQQICHYTIRNRYCKTLMYCNVNVWLGNVSIITLRRFSMGRWRTKFRPSR